MRNCVDFPFSEHMIRFCTPKSASAPGRNGIRFHCTPGWRAGPIPGIHARTCRSRCTWPASTNGRDKRTTISTRAPLAGRPSAARGRSRVSLAPAMPVMRRSAASGCPAALQVVVAAGQVHAGGDGGRQLHRLSLNPGRHRLAVPDGLERGADEDGLGAHRTQFMTDQTGPVHGPGQAAAAVHEGRAHADRPLSGELAGALLLIEA